MGNSIHDEAVILTHIIYTSKKDASVYKSYGYPITVSHLHKDLQKAVFCCLFSIKHAGLHFPSSVACVISSTQTILTTTWVSFYILHAK
jgi:accessory gene regulator protein AgrB